MLFIDIKSQLFRKNYFCCNFLKLNLNYDWTKNRRYSVILFKSGIKRIYSEGRISKYQSIVSRMNHTVSPHTLEYQLQDYDVSGQLKIKDKI